MANIQVLDLQSSGFDLLIDSEGFLDVLDNGELNSINGGLTPIGIWSIMVASEYVIGAMVGGAIVGGVAATTAR